MRNSSIYMLLAIVLVGWSCSSSQKITSSWIHPELKSPSFYNDIFIAAMTDNQGIRQRLESALSDQFGKLGVRAVPSMQVFPPNFGEPDNLDKKEILQTVQALGHDAIFTIALIDVKEEERYHAGQPYQPTFGRFGFYRSFYMYYDFRSPVVYASGYYTMERTYLIESNLYDVKTGDLIWTVQSSSFNPSSFESWFNGYAQLMLTQMNKDGLIQQGPPIIKDDMYDMHTSQNALDWSGTYSGILPCASCEGIHTELMIKDNREYKITTNYLGKQSEPNVHSGKFAWRDENTILLQGLNSSEVPIYYKIEENQIRQLDTSGQLIKGELAGQYVLIKHGNLSIEDKKWQLIELNGRKVKGNDSSHYVIFHSKEGLLEARAGCNNLSYPYVIKNAFQFSAGQGASTMMACQNDLDETELMEAIERADNINFDEMTLSLNKAKMAPLARFELVR